MRLRSHQFCIPAGLILCLAIISTISVKVSARPVSNQSVLAQIDKIVIDDQVVSNPDISKVRVVRASDKTEVAGEIGLSLYANDRVITGAAKIVVRHLSDGQTRSITLGENTNIVILSQSVTLTFGRIWVKASGLFSVKTLYWVLGVSGTRFWVEATPGQKGDSREVSEKSNLSVLEGEVDVSSIKKNEAPLKSPKQANYQAAKPSQNEVLRVKKNEEVDLVGGQPLPKAARPLSPEKIDYIERVIQQVESAGSEPPQPQPEPQPIHSSIWKTAQYAGLQFDVPSDFGTWSGVTRGYLSDGSATQNFDLIYLLAASPYKSGFVSAGHGDVLISSDLQGDMYDLAIRSVPQIFHALTIPGIGLVELNLSDAEIGKLKTMGMQVIETTAVARSIGRQYRVYFAVTFRKTAGRTAKMVYVITGFPVENITDTYRSVGRILLSFKEPRDGVGNADAAKEVVNKLVAEDFEGIRANFNEQMKQTLSVEILKTGWTSAIQNTGKYIGQVDLRRDLREGYDVYTITCRMQRGGLEVEVSYDRNGKIGGLWIRPL
jgi:hypothetical protein